MGSESEFVRGPKWRTRASPPRRHRAAALTFSLVVATGVAVITGSAWLLAWAGAPVWLVMLPWWLPTFATVAWTLVRPTVSGLSDDDDDSWFGYSIRWALVGEREPRPATVRVVTAVLFGAPVAWAILVGAILTLTGLI